MQRVFAVEATAARGGQQVEVMVAQQHRCRAAEAAHGAQRAQRVMATIDQVTEQNQVVVRCIELQVFKQLFERPAFALKITDGKDSFHSGFRICSVGAG